MSARDPDPRLPRRHRPRRRRPHARRGARLRRRPDRGACTTSSSGAFPLPEASRAVPGAPVLTPAEAEAIRADPEALAGLRARPGRMTRFYAGTDGWLRAHDHNHLRITRILAAIRDLAGRGGRGRAFHAASRPGMRRPARRSTATSLRYWDGPPPGLTATLPRAKERIARRRDGATGSTSPNPRPGPGTSRWRRARPGRTGTGCATTSPSSISRRCRSASAASSTIPTRARRWSGSSR